MRPEGPPRRPSAWACSPDSSRPPGARPGVGRQEGRPRAEGVHAEVDGDLQVEVAGEEENPDVVEARILRASSSSERPGCRRPDVAPGACFRGRSPRPMATRTRPALRPMTLPVSCPMNVLPIIALASMLAVAPPDNEPARPRVLVFTKTAGFRHDAIPAGIAAVRELGAEGGFVVDATEDAAAFTPENLARYRAIVFLNTSGEVLDDRQKAAFQALHPGRRRAGGRPPGDHHAREVAVVRRAGRRREVRRASAGPEGDLPTRDPRPPGHEVLARLLGMDRRVVQLRPEPAAADPRPDDDRRGLLPGREDGQGPPHLLVPRVRERAGLVHGPGAHEGGLRPAGLAQAPARGHPVCRGPRAGRREGRPMPRPRPLVATTPPIASRLCRTREHPGDPARGRALFFEPRGAGCARCHRRRGQGGDIGPDLSEVGGKYERALLIESVLEPSRQIVEGYRSEVVATADGRVLSGLVRAESDRELTLVDAEGRRHRRGQGRHRGPPARARRR